MPRDGQGGALGKNVEGKGFEKEERFPWVQLKHSISGR